MKKRRLLDPTLLTAGLLASACSSTGVDPGPKIPVEDVPVFSTTTGERISIDRLAEQLADRRIVILGELHGHPTGLPLNSRLYQGCLDHHPDAPLCLEFLTRDSQYVVDAYTSGLIDWDTFESTCETFPGTNPAPHRPMIEAAQAAGAPIIAANAPRLYTTAAREHGYSRLAELSPEQQRLFATPQVVPTVRYREAFFEKMREHMQENEPQEEGALDEKLEGYYRAQCLWDMTMAQSVARAREQGGGPVFLVVGSFHCNEDGGTVQMIRELTGLAPCVVTFVDQTSEQLLEEHRELADFVAYVGPSP